MAASSGPLSRCRRIQVDCDASIPWSREMMQVTDSASSGSSAPLGRSEFLIDKQRVLGGRLACGRWGTVPHSPCAAGPPRSWLAAVWGRRSAQALVAQVGGSAAFVVCPAYLLDRFGDAAGPGV